MVNFFSKKKSQYNGFAKYNEEYARHSSAPAQRAQSLTGASQAALAALQMHSKPTQPQPARRVAANRPTQRANSFGNYNRANSMQSYTYTPKASYVTGPVAQQSQQRSYSLRSNPRPEARTNSLSGSRTNSLSGSIRSASRKQPVGRLSEFPEEQEHDFADFDDNGEENVVITTKTTKVVDAAGRTKSITTETIRTLPDGSNIIETKTTNVSRSGSRSNSLKNSSSAAHHANPNLRKIEEDLSDFDYTYLDDMNKPEINASPLHAPNQAASSPRLSVHSPPLNSQANTQSLNVLDSPAKITGDRANSISSTQSGRRLKSILKNNSAGAFRVSEGSPVSNDVSPAKADLFSPRDVETSPAVPKTKRHSSMTSGANSIKFLETVETIPYTEPSPQELQKEELLKKEQMKQDNKDLYDKAMQVAMQRVYGAEAHNPAASNTHDVPDSRELDEFTRKKSEKKLKTDVKRSKVEAAGVRPNYVYENHHKEFSMRSMRNGSGDAQTTRKERSKEEQKRAKEEEKKREQLVKEAEKERSSEKKKKRSPFSIFKKDKRKGSVSEESVLTHSSSPSNFSSAQEASPRVNASEFSPRVNADETSPNAQELSPEAQELSPKVNAQEITEINNAKEPGAGSNFVDNAPAVHESDPIIDMEDQVGVTTATANKTEPTVMTDEALAKNDFLPEEDEENDEFVDVPENLEDVADKRLSTIPVVESFEEPKEPKQAKLGEPISLDPRVEGEPAKEYPTLVSGKDGKPKVLSETSNVIVSRTDTSGSSIEANTTSKTEYVDASSPKARDGQEVYILNESSPREALVIDGDFSRSDEDFQAVLPEHTLEQLSAERNSPVTSGPPSDSEPTKPVYKMQAHESTPKPAKSPVAAESTGLAEPENTVLTEPESGAMEGISSSGQKVRVNSRSGKHEAEDSKKKKSTKKGGRFKRTIEKYFLTTYK